ncbi:hypothetical protein [Ruegeria marisrubri]|uniref:hypothetical protein n=1 Tax=Ruegeria marisrubri TaxID=1685379 RepID=UPI0014706AE5|nr:hypothetical protein [Ruegeria marisrubri]
MKKNHGAFPLRVGGDAIWYQMRQNCPILWRFAGVERQNFRQILPKHEGEASK